MDLPNNHNVDLKEAFDVLWIIWHHDRLARLLLNQAFGMHAQVVPVAKASQASLLVAVRVRPVLRSEIVKGNRKDIIRVVDNRIVVVLDPDDTKVSRPSSIHRAGRRAVIGKAHNSVYAPFLSNSAAPTA